MHELEFISDLMEERLVKGNLRWLANFNEIHRDYPIDDVVVPIYASGSLQEKGFILSRIYSGFITPRYRIHFLFYTSSQMDPKSLRKLILACKNKFMTDDWIFLGLVQSQPLERTLKEAVANTADKSVGIVAFSLSSKETVTSNNVLGKGLARQLRLTEANFEAFDLPNYVKSLAIIFSLGTLMLLVIALLGLPQAIHPLTLLLMAVFSVVGGYRLYKTRYHTTLSLNEKGFQLKEGNNVKEGNWSNFSDISIFVSPKHEIFLRLQAKEPFDIPLSRTGIARKEAYNAIKQLIKKKAPNR